MEPERSYVSKVVLKVVVIGDSGYVIFPQIELVGSNHIFKPSFFSSIQGG